MRSDGVRGTFEAVHRWLDVGRDVVVRGDDGSGRTSVLEALLTDASRRGATSLLLRAGGRGAYAALLTHESAPTRGRPPTEAELVEWLVGELGGRSNLLLVDDLDRLDEGSVAVLARALQRTDAALVASTTRDLVRSPDGLLAALVAERAPAEVRLLPLGLTAVAHLLATTLGAPADVALVSSVTARSSGNPRVALALIDAARYAGVIERADGLWAKVGSFDDVPLDAVAIALLARLDEREVEALELVAWLGTVPVDAAAKMTDGQSVAALVAHGRLVSYQVGASPEALTVSPPALAEALRRRLGRHRRHHLGELVTSVLGPDQLPVAHGATGPGRLVLTEEEGEEHGLWAAELAGLVHERASAREAARRADWQLAPTVLHANAFLGVLMRRPAREQIAAVFRGTELAEDDDPQQRAVFRLFQARWDVWSRGGAGDMDDWLREHAAEVEPFRPLVGLREGVVRDVAAGMSDDALVGVPGEALDLPYLRGWPAVVRAGALLEAGRPDAVVRLCEAADELDLGPEMHHYLDGLRGEALLLLGELQDAELWSRRLLERAFDDLDPLGIRVHASVLAEILLFAGRPKAAWRVVSTSLRLGPAGPIENTFYRRGLSIGAVLQARAGDVAFAEVLVAELESTPAGYRPLIGSMRVLARSALDLVRGDEDASAERLWEKGGVYLERGLPQPALMCWLLSPRRYDAERMRTVGETFARSPLPLFEPYLRLHVAVASGDQEAVATALAGVNPELAAGLAATAAGMLPESSVAVGRPGRRGTHIEALSAREREVASMARSGLSNRQIADDLVLSVRTVENHMSRALRKLGYSSRSDLDRWVAL